MNLKAAASSVVKRCGQRILANPPASRPVSPVISQGLRATGKYNQSAIVDASSHPPPLPPIRLYSTEATSNAYAPTCGSLPQQSGEPAIDSFFEPATSTWQYVVSDPTTKKAVIIDSVLDFSPASGEISTKTADSLLAFIKQKGLEVIMILETHAHADHLTAAQYLKSRLGGSVPVAIGKRITGVQKTFAKVYGVPKESFEGTFDKLWEDDETFRIGNLECHVMHLPGHTPDHVGYRCGNALFVGDTLFYPDVGSARADFPGGSPTDLYQSVQRVLSLDPDVQVFAGHDYPPEGEKPGQRCWSLVSEQRRKNVHLRARRGPEQSAPDAQEKDKDAFIRWRAQRDRTLGAPRLLHPALQVNICAGRLPQPDESGRRMFKIPLKVPEGL
ncbi:metallo-beta-lactamase [Coprinopsis marcescibilis]|uniref:Metallo-beta-lactamase n=1 Tax=Coprinopsis marcescibilis TaxID=230819 RepID=A0A5C3KEW3_COPMA|nr:metallo-beta-lactamase [Coprinopsis marcescibilis]